MILVKDSNLFFFIKFSEFCEFFKPKLMYPKYTGKQTFKIYASSYFLDFRPMK